MVIDLRDVAIASLQTVIYSLTCQVATLAADNEGLYDEIVARDIQIEVLRGLEFRPNLVIGSSHG